MTWLRVAAVIVVGQTLAEVVDVASRSELTVALRVALMVVLSFQLLFARAVLRFSAAAVFGLLAFQLMTIVAAIGARGWVGGRIVLAASALAVIVCLLAALPAFPTPNLPAGSRR